MPHNIYYLLLITYYLDYTTILSQFQCMLFYIFLTNLSIIHV